MPMIPRTTGQLEIQIPSSTDHEGGIQRRRGDLPEDQQSKVRGSISLRRASDMQITFKKLKVC